MEHMNYQFKEYKSDHTDMEYLSSIQKKCQSEYQK